MKPALDDLPVLGRRELVALWEGTFKRSPPANISRRLMRMAIAFELQSRISGGLKASLKRELLKVRATERQTTRTAQVLKSGARLVREWNGISHVVDITDDGIVWNGKKYQSLTAVARAITGAHWSGPRFFGLKR